MRRPVFLLTITATVAMSLLVLRLGPQTSFADTDDPCADLNGDGEVTANDIWIVISYLEAEVGDPLPWPPSPPYFPQVDMNSDGAIMGDDVLAVALLWGKTTDCQGSPIHAWGSFPGVGDDTFFSLGKFRIAVAPQFRPLMAGYPGYDSVTWRLTSPTLSDPFTLVGRSAPHTDGSAPDVGGTLVGTAATVISDGSFSLVPAGFEGPMGTREVHTEVRTLNLTGAGAAVRAGTAAPDQPISPGEVESWSDSGDPTYDYAAESFFNVFVEVDLPALAGFPPGGTLYNAEPLLVANSKLELLPPRVVYIHGNTAAVPVLFKSDNPGFWQADDLFGHLVLAGHGARFALGDTELFEDIMEDTEQEQGEMPLPDPVGGIAELVDVAEAPLEVAESSERSVGVLAGITAGVAAGAIALGSAVWYTRRRWFR